MTTKNKKVTPNNVKKANGKMFIKKKIIVDVSGDSFDIVVDQVFKPSDISLAMEDTLQIYSECEELGLQLSPLVLNAFAIVKHFTDINFDYDVKTQIQLFVDMCNNGMVETIIESIPESETDKLNKAGADMLENLPKINAMLAEAYNKQAEIYDKINKEMSEKVVEVDSVDKADDING